ncbi:PREDICTED: plastid lipid-associated protein 2, chloroplastic [Tarenaya hassleriana]|uniref:plastid lipid-associated protein 2, chloroplastic n=1 Tax=Tarenaya hassleriana TaxID=28532 RepID=UPI00053C8A0C|nr:PREDICTED: plastid lipid-associated protein 2, chloroplastic [Tarenaya hassleriana]XP_019057887.1 PREDICTED: plastid lipid-associated protein 2, chloroplastic [Tarenaya hassleriana]
MASVSLFNKFPCKTQTPTSCNTKSQLKHAILVPMSSINRRPTGFAGGISVSRPVFRVRASEVKDERDDEPAEEGSSVSVAESAAAKTVEVVDEIEQLKRALVDSLNGTDRGLSASSDKRAEIGDLITQLEAKNPTPAPTDALFLLNGKWILAYTSFSALFPLLSRGYVPVVKLDEISQMIDSDNFTVQNSIRFASPLATASISTNSKFEVRSPRRVQIKFEEGIIGTPQLTDSIQIPEEVKVLGQKINLTPIKGLLTSLQGTASSMAKTISSQPPLKFSLPGSNAQSWLLTTYLDKDLRISRGDGGSVFVLFKEGNSLLKPSN